MYEGRARHPLSRRQRRGGKEISCGRLKREASWRFYNFCLKVQLKVQLLTQIFRAFLLGKHSNIFLLCGQLFFKPFFFEAALSVNLTTMQVMTTIFISKMEGGLPPTPDIKMIDIWLILCQMVPFAEVVLLTAMEYHRRDHHNEIVKEEILCFADEDDATKIDVEETQDRHCTKNWLPDLKTTGRLKSLLHLNKYLSR